MFFGEDGSLENSAGEIGSWNVVDGSICNIYVDRGSAGCDKVFRKDNGDIFYVVPSGKTGTIESIEDGNLVSAN